MIAERILAEAVRAQSMIDNRQCGLDDYLDRHLELEESRRTLTDLLFTIYRRRRALDGFIGGHTRKPPEVRIVMVLRAALAQMWFQRGIRPESAANVAVAYVRKHISRNASGFCNALLRRGAAEGMPQVSSWLPPALEERWQARFGSEERSRLERLWLEHPRPVWRWLGSAPPEMEEGMAELEFPWCGRWRFYSSQLGMGEWLARHADWLERGLAYLQDPATALAVSLAPLAGEERVLDLCAAPGGKSLLLAGQLAGEGTLTLCDRSAERMRRLEDNVRRYGVKAELVTADGTAPPFAGKRRFDYILADVPCSNTGVYRRRPDALWRFDGAALKEVTALQERLLESAARCLARGGRLVYSTCSLEPEENTLLLSRWLERHPEFELEDERLLLPEAEHDGAFAGVLRLK